MRSLLIKNSQTIFALLLILTIATRYIYSYSDSSERVREPERLFSTFIGLDFMIGAMGPAIHMFHGNDFYSVLQTYGPSFSVMLIPVLKTMAMTGVCPESDLFACGLSAYFGYLLFCMIGLVILLFITSKSRGDMRVLFLMYGASYFLSIPGTLLINRGNLDLFFTLIFGILLIPLYRSKSKKDWLWPVIIGFLTGFLSNSKIFLLPFSILILLVSQKKLLSIGIFMFTYCVFLWLPTIFGAPSSVSAPLRYALKTEEFISLANAGYLGFNHTLAATATWATSCVAKYSCDYFKVDAIIIQALRIIGVIFVFILPFLLSSPLRSVLFSKKSPGTYIIDIIRIYDSNHQKVILLGLIIVYGIINLLPNAAFLYRLTYALPLFVILWIWSEKNEKSREFVLYSMIFLLFKGQWINYVIAPNGWSFTDPRFMNIFVIFHVFFLIRSGIEVFQGNKNVKHI